MTQENLTIAPYADMGWAVKDGNGEHIIGVMNNGELYFVRPEDEGSIVIVVASTMQRLGALRECLDRVLADRNDRSKT